MEPNEQQTKQKATSTNQPKKRKRGEVTKSMVANAVTGGWTTYAEIDNELALEYGNAKDNANKREESFRRAYFLILAIEDHAKNQTLDMNTVALLKKCFQDSRDYCLKPDGKSDLHQKVPRWIMESKSRTEATLKKMAAREWIWRFVEGYRPDHPTVKKLRQHHKIPSNVNWLERAEVITDYQQEPGSSAKKRNSEGAQPSISQENFSSPDPQQPTVAPATQKLTTLASARAEAQSLQRQLHEQSEKHESDLNRAQIEAYQKTKETMDKFRRSYEARIQELTKARPENSPPVFDPYDPEAIPWGRPMGRFKLDHFQIAERQGHSAEYLANVNVISLGGRTGYVPAANCLEIALDTELERIMPSAYLFKPKDDETADEIVCEDWDPRAFHGVQLPQDHEVLCTGETWGEVKERLDKEHDNAQSTISTLSPGCCSVRPMPTMTVANTKVPGIERETFSKMEESSKARSLQICGVKRLGHHLIAESQLLFRAAAIKNDKGLRALSQADEAQTILRGEEEACLVRMMEKLTILDE